MADEPLTGEAVWFAHERRIQRLEEGMSDLGRAMVKVEQDIQKNVQLTGQIRDEKFVTSFAVARRLENSPCGAADSWACWCLCMPSVC